MQWVLQWFSRSALFGIHLEGFTDPGSVNSLVQNCVVSTFAYKMDQSLSDNSLWCMTRF